MVEHIKRQTKFSETTFGPGDRAKGVVEHIRKELMEVEENLNDIFEWIDVILLALDGVRRQGYSGEQISAALEEKLTINENRNWPDWRTIGTDKAITHKK